MTKRTRLINTSAEGAHACEERWRCHAATGATWSLLLIPIPLLTAHLSSSPPTVVFLGEAEVEDGSGMWDVGCGSCRS
ncbi:uncharacterized protein EI97DRAFT_228000 [Westerdykella ornata]|uniref:Uncharacterized protein n=1 Tax=Westerdykella ornata TaxID=318751 RepID=A0A6A6JTP3_WESOR|nr:uncharacterized protein EI97DRAFT_228000 [Westerdykella ornata]KAF2279126.1 hypothetical protein EI97DRAFT_228000 [Westerdykella ornata]